jgi:hypothetical protein
VLRFRSSLSKVLQFAQLTTGQTVVVLGCPGGRVRVLQPGQWRPDDNTAHGHGTLDESIPDFGFGGSALAVRHEAIGQEKLVIWFGTVSHPPVRPGNYGTATASLALGEEATGSVVRMEWVPGSTGSGFQNIGTPVTFHPSAAQPRGAYAVVGLCLTDLEEWPGQQLIVATMSGDLIVLDADTMLERWRTNVDGGIGCYNSIVAADLNDDGYVEIYVAGSKGLWRFTQQSET